MIITKVQSITKTKMRVFFDGEPAFVASAAQLRLWGLYEGKELDEKQTDTLRHQICIYAARTAAELLARREYSAHDLNQKLRAKEFPAYAVLFAIDYVRQKHYQDDKRCAEAYIRSHCGKKSRMQIRASLRERGISDEIIEDALDQCGAEDINVILSDLEKRLMPEGKLPDPGDPAYNKMIQTYLRRGFRFGDIREAFSVYTKSSYSD